MIFYDLGIKVPRLRQEYCRLCFMHLCKMQLGMWFKHFIQLCCYFLNFNNKQSEAGMKEVHQFTTKFLKNPTDLY